MNDKVTDPKQKHILMIVAPENYRDEEYEVPRKLFEEKGHSVTVASKGVKQALGILGGKAQVDLDIAAVKLEEYDALVFVGGSGASIYFNDRLAHALIIRAHSSAKIIGAICIAPTILANSGILEKRSVTSFSSEQNKLTVHGARFTGEKVTVDQRIITANGPEAAKDFALAIMSLLRGIK